MEFANNMKYQLRINSVGKITHLIEYQYVTIDGNKMELIEEYTTAEVNSWTCEKAKYVKQLIIAHKNEQQYTKDLNKEFQAFHLKCYQFCSKLESLDNEQYQTSIVNDKRINLLKEAETYLRTAEQKLQKMLNV